MTTDTLLIIIAVLLAVRIVLQLRQGKRAFEKMYFAPSEVENVVRIANDSPTKCDINYHLEWASINGYELVCVERGECYDLYLFFTRKKIKNFLEE